MSMFQETAVACPMCGSEVEFEVVQSVNVDRRPELRAAILDGSFQRKACPSCGKQFRVEPELVYMDLQRGQYLGAWPATRRHDWKALAAQTRKTFDDALGSNAPASARKLGQAVQVRAVFGWWALAEKILARQLGIDDCTLEAAKLAVMRTQEESPLPGHSELRLVREQDGDLIFAWLGSPGGGGEQTPPMRVPRQLINDIEAVTDGEVVDFQREMLVG
jgi:endogenous inhibitor of DNA gyrase (YacG/DUF329 family)